MNPYDVSVGVFIRALTNLKAQLTKAEDHVASSGADEATMLGAQLSVSEPGDGVSNASPYDLHMYSLADQVHWAAEGARLAIVRLLGERPSPVANSATSFADLHQRLDETIAYLREIAPGDLEAGLERPMVFEHRRGTVHSTGSQFLLGYAIPHFFYHVTTAYGILRNQGVSLTMADFLGNWGAA